MEKAATTLCDAAFAAGEDAKIDVEFRRRLYGAASLITASAGPNIRSEEKEGIAECLRLQMKYCFRLCLLCFFSCFH